jgi:hypothetical protein
MCAPLPSAPLASSGPRKRYERPGVLRVSPSRMSGSAILAASAALWYATDGDLGAPPPPPCYSTVSIAFVTVNVGAPASATPTIRA